MIKAAPTNLIRSIENDLDKLEDVLQPLFEQPLEAIMDKLEVMERAKLATLIPYVANDLIISLCLFIIRLDPF